METPTFEKLHELWQGDDIKTFTNHIGLQVDCKVVGVNDVSQTFDVFLNVHCHYKLPRDIADTDAARRAVGPNLGEANGFAIVPEEEFEFYVPVITLNNCRASKFDDFLKTIRVNKRTGDIWVQYENFCTIFEDLELVKFPYDRQVFRIYLNTLGVGVLPWHIDISSADYPLSKQPTTNDDVGMLSFQAKNWKLRGKKVDVTGIVPYLLNGSTRNIQKVMEKQLQKDHDYRITYVADRDQSYYVTNYILISAFLVFATSSVFLIPVNNVEERQGLTITILLALVALKFALSTNTPVIGYSTYLDLYLLGWYLMLFLAIFWNFLASTIVLYRCDNQLADEECIALEEQEIRDIESVLVFIFIAIWVALISLMICFGLFKDDYQTTIAKQAENKQDIDTLISLESDPGEEPQEDETPKLEA